MQWVRPAERPAQRGWRSRRRSRSEHDRWGRGRGGRRPGRGNRSRGPERRGGGSRWGRRRGRRVGAFATGYWVGEKIDDLTGASDKLSTAAVDADPELAMKAAEHWDDAGAEWDRGDHLSAVGDGAAAIGDFALGTAEAAGGAIVDGVEAAGSAIADGAEAVWDGDHRPLLGRPAITGRPSIPAHRRSDAPEEEASGASIVRICSCGAARKSASDSDVPAEPATDQRAFAPIAYRLDEPSIERAKFHACHPKPSCYHGRDERPAVAVQSETQLRRRA